MRQTCVHEMLIHQVPILLGGGERLFAGVDGLHGLELVETVAAPNVTHSKSLERGPASRRPPAVLAAVTISRAARPSAAEQ